VFGKIGNQLRSPARKFFLITLFLILSVSAANLTTLLNSIAAGIKNSTISRIFIPKSLLSAQSYVFTVVLTNFLGGTRTETYTVVVQAGADRPVVELNIDNLDFSTDIKIQAKVTPPPSACAVSASGSVYNWTSSSFSVGTTANKDSVYLIPRNTLNPSTVYTINLSVGFVGLTKYPFSKTFTTKAERITVDSGASGQVAFTSNLTLTPFIQSDVQGRFLFHHY
jgi:hypothetical protein